MNRFRERFEQYLRREISIDFKTCAYLFCIAFFYCCYRISQGSFLANILHLFEMMADAYVVGYLQVYLLGNFDEANRLGRLEAFGIALCSLLHGAASFILGWFEGKWQVSVFLAVFMMICYITVFFCNKIKRRADTENLNRMLAEFKKGETYGEESGQKLCD